MSDIVSSSPKKTILYENHISLGAKMVPFAGFLMPVQYAGIRQEHEAVRRQAGLFDVSHMGNFIVKGPDAAAFLQKITTNNVAKLQPGDAQYSALCFDHGGVVDDIIVYCWEPSVYMIVVNAANIAKDWEWFGKYRQNFQVTMENSSEDLAILSLQGPHCLGIIQKMGLGDLETLGYYKCRLISWSGKDFWVARTGYTGEDGFEFFPTTGQAQALWDSILASGTSEGILPIGLGARDTLRLEAGFSLYGHELSESINVLEAGLGWITDFDKGDFVGRASLWAVKQAGVQRKMTGVEMDDLAIPRGECEVWHRGHKVGMVTSGTQSPTLGKGIALALVEPAASERGQVLEIKIRDTLKSAKAVPRTFYRRPKISA